MIDIFYEEPLPPSIQPSALEAFVQAVVTHLNIKEIFSLSFIDAQAMQELNRTYRGKDYPTDVLTFTLEEEPDDPFLQLSQDDEPKSLGDILICLATVAQNAQEFNVSLHEETKRVIIHGILHLLGKNHATNEANEPMLIEQELIMKELKELSLQ
ncbi:rRNA maturation RNase YbeY [Entomospira culicis]|uniref:Endoribonuclease YbeY n=1 Tax=Entomospira culicis TaxID=2719989 RepID=A0A968GHC7_9SPIO|nr:rRNA maturation RNase YbeY [Entomospira culicis]NIZ18832.1 rRNA maturation RNase YbeY [Entomospira culicis]NIZ69047.1 rRNA maturation RNase YbeY [Entomospira culicis]WDI37635.1 rRNA maturation RNase YbeY [Entomospira culicis]WDI39263.1 rRNA maturation RNase YbeY [Entomospira culicis]